MERKKPKVTLGIDIGLGGALAILNGGRLQIDDMPIIPKPYGKGNMISPVLLADLIKNYTEKYHITGASIETVAAMAGQGVTSVFSFGRSTGVIEGVIASFDIPIWYVTPQKWKREFGLIGKDKQAARMLVLGMYPSYKDLFKFKKDVDRADAVLIGKYLERIKE